MVSDAEYTLSSLVGFTIKKKLQSIFSLGKKTSFVHFRLFMNVFRAVCNVWKTFLFTLVPTWLLLTVTRAFNSWALAKFAAINNRNNNLILVKRILITIE